MVAGTKTFLTQFLIGAKWTGGPGVQAARRQLGGLAKTVQTAGVHVKGMTRAVFGGVSAQRALEGAARHTIQVLLKSFAAASQVQEAHDELALSMERNATRYKSLMGKSATAVAASINESTLALIAASEQMEKTGHDAESLQIGFAKLAATGALDPKQILAQREAFSDVLSYISGANATAEESAGLGELWADAILRGNIALLKQLDLSTGEIALFQHINKLIKEGTITGEEGIKRRQDLLLKFGKKFEGETKRVFEKPSGKIQRMWIQVGNVFENLGKPFIDRAPEMAQAFTTLAEDIKPAADQLARLTAEGLKGISDWFKEHKTDIPVWLKTIEDRLKGVYDVLTLINKVPVLFDLPAAIKRWMQPARLGQLPGAPNQQINPALAQGEAGRRRAEAEAKKATNSGGYAPYQIQRVRKAESAAIEATKAAPSGTGAASLAAARARVATELKDPETQRLLSASVLAEMGDQSPAAQQQYMETVVNRATAEGRSLAAVLSDPKYYPEATTSRLSKKISPKEAERMQAMVKEVVGGSNLANFATGNESLNVGYKSRARGIWMPILARALGPGGYERFVGEPHTRSWVERMQAGAAKPASLRDMIRPVQRGGPAAGTSAAMNPTTNINISGVQPGRESLMAHKAALAMRNPLAEGLRQLKAMRAQEQRLGYV